MEKCSVFSTVLNGKVFYGVECGGVRVPVSENLSKADVIMKKCNYYGVCPEHLEDVVKDELYDG